jgi:hypothetical protein
MSKDDVMADIQETEENKIVFDQLRESFTVLETNYSKQLNKWINTLIKLDLTVNISTCLIGIRFIHCYCVG